MDDKILYGVIGGLLSLIIGLVAYIWNSNIKGSMKQDTALEASIVKLETSFSASITELNTTIMSLRTIIFEEIEYIKREQNKTKISLAEVRSLCKERSKHCPLYSMASAEGKRDDGEPDREF